MYGTKPSLQKWLNHKHLNKTFASDYISLTSFPLILKRFFMYQICLKDRGFFFQSKITPKQAIKTFWDYFREKKSPVLCLKYSETCLKRPLKHRQNKGLKDNGSLMKVKSIAECSKREHSAIFSTCISNNRSLKPIFGLLLSDRLRQVLPYLVFLVLE